jgi:hypothetical protein
MNRDGCKLIIVVKGDKYHMMACGKPVYVVGAPMRDWLAVFINKQRAQDFLLDAQNSRMDVGKDRVRIHL